MAKEETAFGIGWRAFWIGLGWYVTALVAVPAAAVLVVG